MNKIEANLDFADSNYKYFKILEQGDEKENLIIYIDSWDAKIITLEFLNVIYFSYNLSYVIEGLFELKNEESLLNNALNYVSNKKENVLFSVFGLIDINDNLFFKIIAEDVILKKNDIIYEKI